MTLAARDFDYVRTLLRGLSAIALEDHKSYLVEARLTRLARHEGFPSIEALIAECRRQSTGPLHYKVVDAMTTNETSFFRDQHPFETLRTRVLPDLMAKRAPERRLTLWCAACSSGQEPYSVVMLLREHFPQLATWTVRILATDISAEMLTRARAGRYTQAEVERGLPAALRAKYFEPDGGFWQVKNALRERVEFYQVNLAAAWPALPAMDVVLLRNVLIYFDVKTKKAILGRLHQVLKPDGYLFLGASETTLYLDDAFERVQLNHTVCYRRH